MPADSVTAESRQVALAFIERCFRCDVEGVLALLAPDATWWVLGSREHLRVSGTRDLHAIQSFLRRVARLFPRGMQYRIAGVTAEDGRVAIEAASTATQADGRPYANHYHFLVEVRGGRVIAVREYLDTLYAWQIQQATGFPARGAPGS